MHLSPQVTLSWVQILCAVSSLVFVHDEARQLRFFEAQMLLAAVQSPQYSVRWQVFLPHLRGSRGR